MTDPVEWLDIYDENGALLGRKEREAVHRDGDWHRTFDCWLVRANPRPAVLFQKRAASKRDNPGLLDTSVAGHLLAGEPLAAGTREIQEELGLTIPFEELVGLGTRIAVARTETRIDHEFQSLFLANREVSPSELDLAPGEVEGVAWIETEAGLDLFSGRRPSLTLDLWGADRTERVLTVTPDAFVRCHDRYYTKVFWLVERFVSGCTDLAI